MQASGVCICREAFTGRHTVVLCHICLQALVL